MLEKEDILQQTVLDQARTDVFMVGQFLERYFARKGMERKI